MTNLQILLDQHYAPQGGYQRYIEMRTSTPPATVRQIARHFNDIDTRTVVRWNRIYEEIQNRNGIIV